MGVEESDLQVTARLNDQESIKNLVAGGMGVSIISAKAAQDFARAGRLLTFTLPGGGAERSLYLVYRPGDYLDEQARHFIRFVETYYGAGTA